jgi:protein phosphatase
MEESTAEYAVQQLAPREELRFRPRVSVGAKTDLGRVRENNEDKFEFFVPSTDAELAWRGMVFVVCDGMGGHEAGQIASELACKTFINVYRDHPSDDPAEASRSAAHAANRFVLDVARAVPSRKGMGTTLSAIAIIQDRAIVTQVGDSRVYRVREGEIQPLTTDHTWVEETVALGMMSREAAEAHQYRHVLTRAIGTEPEIKSDVTIEDVRAGDTFVLCSDGVTNHVSDAELLELVQKHGPSEAAWAIIGKALVGGGSDNATVIVVHLDALEDVSPSSPETRP